MELSQFGASGAVVVVVIIFLKYMREDQRRRDKTYNKMAQAMERNTKATKSAAEVTKSADLYLRDRNGRDAEAHAKTIESIEAIPQKMQAIADRQAEVLTENLKNLPAQQIVHQHVEDQVIRKTK